MFFIHSIRFFFNCKVYICKLYIALLSSLLLYCYIAIIYVHRIFCVSPCAQCSFVVIMINDYDGIIVYMYICSSSIAHKQLSSHLIDFLSLITLTQRGFLTQHYDNG